MADDKKRVYRKNTVHGKQRGRKYTPELRETCVIEAIVEGNLTPVAQRHKVPESTIRTWVRAAQQPGPGGTQSLYDRLREENIREISAKAAIGAKLSLDMTVRRLRASDECERRRAEIRDRLTGTERIRKAERERMLREYAMRSPMSDYDLTKAFCALVDKGALAAGEPTLNMGIDSSSGALAVNIRVVDDAEGVHGA